MKFGRDVVFEFRADRHTDRQTDRQTDILITILGSVEVVNVMQAVHGT